MGCWDVFCFICCNPWHDMLDGIIENSKKQYNYIVKTSYIGEHNINPIFISFIKN